MADPKTLLVVWHSQSGGTAVLADAHLEAAHERGLIMAASLEMGII